MKKILIGAPVYKRDWVLPTWFKALKDQVGDFSLGFIFYCSPDDSSTMEALTRGASEFDVWHFELIMGEGKQDQERRAWNKDRYEYMSFMRNELLEKARLLSPDKYLSLDSDILLEDPRTISRLDHATDTYADAANPLMFMTPESDKAPSYMTWSDTHEGRAFRERPRKDYGAPIQVDVIMAAKMMSRETYMNVEYSPHPQGEDLGWSYSCKEKGLKLYCLEDIYASHMMSKKMLEAYVDRGDPRKSHIRVVK